MQSCGGCDGDCGPENLMITVTVVGRFVPSRKCMGCYFRCVGGGRHLYTEACRSRLTITTLMVMGGGRREGVGGYRWPGNCVAWRLDQSATAVTRLKKKKRCIVEVHGLLGRLSGDDKGVTIKNRIERWDDCCLTLAADRAGFEAEDVQRNEDTWVQTEIRWRERGGVVFHGARLDSGRLL